MISICILSAISLIMFTLVWWWYSTIRKYKSLRKLSGPRWLPIVGNAHQIGSNPPDIFKNLIQLNQLHGNTFKLYLGFDMRVITTDPDLVEYLLSSNVHINKSNSYDLLKPWLGEGLITSSGSKWKDHRKMIAPTFHFKILEQFFEVFDSQCDILIEVLAKNANKVINIATFVNLYTLDVLCETAMGIRINAQRCENSEYVKAIEEFMDIISLRYCSFWQRNDLLYHFSSNYKNYKRCLKTMHDFTDSVIKKRREEFKTKQLNAIQDDVGLKQKVALLDLLLEYEDSSQLPSEDVRSEVDTFMFAGHDALSTAISFALLALAKNPDVQEKLYQEIIEVMGSDNKSPITIGNLNDMTYLDMVLKESQRYYTTVPFVERRLEEDCCIKGLQYPAGTKLLMWIYGLHHSEKIFPNPERFEPNRFLPENVTQRHKFAYVPFSAGPRNCIGQKFALLEMKITIVKVVREFKLLADPNFEPILVTKIGLKSYNGVQLRLQYRTI